MVGRRRLFSAFAKAAVGACIAANIPAGILPSPIRRRAATERLSAVYHQFFQTYGVAPKEIYAGRELFEAFQSEIIPNDRRIEISVDHLGRPEVAYRATKVCKYGHGWQTIVRIPA